MLLRDRARERAGTGFFEMLFCRATGRGEQAPAEKL